MTTIYRDHGPLFDAWCELSMPAQWLVTTIDGDTLTARTGVSYTVRERWANTARGVEVTDIDRALAELSESGWLVVDDRAGLTWLWSYMIDRAIFTQPDRVRGALQEITTCRSNLIREAVENQIETQAAGSAGLSLGGRRSRKAVPAEVRLAVYERDEWTCQECHKGIPPRGPQQLAGELAPHDDDGWLELDHVEPWSRGGLDVVENFRAACSQCNRERGATPLLDGEHA